MRMILLMILLLVSSAAGAEYVIKLTSPDGSIQICSSTGFGFAGLELDIDVTACVADKIFKDGMGG